MSPRESYWLRCYPPAWRARYGEELQALIVASSDGGSVPWRIRLDLARSGARERLRSAGLSGDRIEPHERARTSILLVLCAWALFAVAGIMIQKFSEHWQHLAPISDRGLPAGALEVLVVAAVIGSALVLTGITCALPRLLSYLRGGGWGTIRPAVIRAARITALAVMSTVGLAVWAHHLDSTRRNGGDLAYGLAFTMWALVMLASLTSWTAAAIAIARRITFTTRLLRLEAKLTAAISLTMLTMTFATAVWWGALASSEPWALHGLPAGSGASPFAFQLLIATPLMVLATGLASFETARSLRAVARLD